ncbi:hypothetical protein RsY01_2004 [Lactococcus reticulitermitis]|uniref:Uncharacterized protein n=1 Tax=Pseudolactococcus reticulitermitis TaxID=2025039 RepID=A0A224XEQ5_9LACT|nr:hypothetical protein RsY01_2004 [Lactococcus reticulitermitis]
MCCCQWQSIISINIIFSDIAEELTFASENGAYLKSQGKVLFVVEMPHYVFEKALAILVADYQGEGIICGKKSAYILETAPETFYNYTYQYYYRLARVPGFSTMFEQDTIVKMAFNSPEQMQINRQKIDRQSQNSRSIFVLIALIFELGNQINIEFAHIKAVDVFAREVNHITMRNTLLTLGSQQAEIISPDHGAC